MKKQTQAIHTAFQHPDTYGALAMPVYHTAAYEFGNAAEMADDLLHDILQAVDGASLS